MASSDEDQINRLFERYVAAFRAGDVEACADCYAEDAEYIASGTVPLRGRAAITALHRDLIGSGLVLEAMPTDELRIAGDLAYARQRVIVEGGGADAMIVLRRQADGAWLVHAEAEVAWAEAG